MVERLPQPRQAGLFDENLVSHVTLGSPKKRRAIAQLVERLVRNEYSPVLLTCSHLLSSAFS